MNNKSTKNFLFCCIYRHPRSDINTLILHFSTILQQLTNKQVFIMGDFTSNSLNYDSHTPIFDFMNTLFSNNFVPCIIHPTIISNNSATIIKNCQATYFSSASRDRQSIFSERNIPKLIVAKVVPVFKQGNQEIRSNFRPISLLPIFSKIFEKLVYKEGFTHLLLPIK